MPTFNDTVNPTPFGFFDDDTDFQTEAAGVVTFVKRSMGDDTLSVELTSKEIWMCFEEATLEYSRQIHEFRTKNELVNVLGLPTGSTDMTNRYPRKTLEYLVRQAEPYASFSDVGGSFDSTLCYLELIGGVQDYNIYETLKVANGVDKDNLIISTMPSGSRGKLRVVEVFHVEPLAAQHFLLNASNITNFLATNFNYESYVNSTIFYVLPVFEDILRRGMLETAFRVRRSNYHFQVLGSKLRIYPIPSTQFQIGKLFINVSSGQQNPLAVTGSAGNAISYQDDSIYGISDPSNMPFGNLPFVSITQPGRQWIRQYTLALAREVLGLVRSKMDVIPVPNAEVRLNGEALYTQGREDKSALLEQIKEFLGEMTHEKLQERESNIAENMQKQLRFVPMPHGRSIIIG